MYISVIYIQCVHAFHKRTTEMQDDDDTRNSNMGDKTVLYRVAYRTKVILFRHV